MSDVQSSRRGWGWGGRTSFQWHSTVDSRHSRVHRRQRSVNKHLPLTRLHCLSVALWFCISVLLSLCPCLSVCLSVQRNLQPRLPTYFTCVCIILMTGPRTLLVTHASDIKYDNEDNNDNGNFNFNSDSNSSSSSDSSNNNNKNNKR